MAHLQIRQMADLQTRQMADLQIRQMADLQIRQMLVLVQIRLRIQPYMHKNYGIPVGVLFWSRLLV
jgi:hypothetical protein